MPTVLCFGELLWDHLPQGPRLGGAPANVAYHLAQLGLEVSLASCVGSDAAGDRALGELSAAGVDVGLVERSAIFPTGRVTVQMDAADAPQYRIDEGVAWDAIASAPPLFAAAERVDALVFGTLAQRSPASRETLAALLERSVQALRLCDLNLRPPFVDAEIVRVSLARASILKLNEDELTALPGLLSLAGSAKLPQGLLEEFGLERIYLTRGAAGASYFDRSGCVDSPAPAVSVVDSVGAGDAFTAALLWGELQGHPAQRTLDDACAVGAYVASRAGAMPAWPETLHARLRAD